MMQVESPPRPTTADPAERAAKLARLREAEEAKRKLRGAKLGVILQNSDAPQLPAGQSSYTATPYDSARNSTSNSPIRSIVTPAQAPLPGTAMEKVEEPPVLMQSKIEQLRATRPLSRAASPAGPVKIVAQFTNQIPVVPDTPPPVRDSDTPTKALNGAWEDQPIAPSKENLEAPEEQGSKYVNSYVDITKMSAEELAQWCNTPIPPNVKVLSHIVRRKNGLDALHPQYECHIQFDGINKQFAMSARRRRKTKLSNYIITASKLSKFTEKADIIGKVKANFIGTCFNIYDDGQNPFKKDGHEEDEKAEGSENRKELGTIIYDTNVFGLKGPRKMTIVLPRVVDGKAICFQPSEERDCVQERYHYNSKDPQLLCLRNKAPSWNENTQSYVLNFHGRVSVASVKNFQVEEAVETGEDKDSRVLLQFGRIGDDTFTLDFEHPLTPLQAFAVALTSFDAKLACE